MEALKSLLETLKSTAYSVLAVLLPGAAFLELFQRVTPLSDKLTQAGAISYVAMAYVAGAAAQGIASLLFSLKPLRSLIAREGLREAEDHAQRILESRLGEKISRERVFDLCLSRVESRREGYDRFVALRDMSRGLALASLLAAALIVMRHRDQLLSMPYGSALFGCLLATAAFLERYRRFAPLGKQIVYAQFVAGEIK